MYVYYPVSGSLVKLSLVVSVLLFLIWFSFPFFFSYGCLHTRLLSSGHAPNLTGSTTLNGLARVTYLPLSDQSWRSETLTEITTSEHSVIVID